ncbi:MAG: alpha/beta hydrolase [Gemmatimonadota bacterium]
MSIETSLPGARRRPGRLLGTLILAAAALSPSKVSAQAACSLVPVDGGEIYACEYGAGPSTVVLAAGAGQHSGSWSGIVERLAESHRVVTFDRPGLGRSPSIDGPRTPTRIAGELAEVLDHLGIEDRVLVVGHSMGGLHAVRFAAMHPDRVGRVVMVDTPPPGFEQARMSLLSPEEQAERRRLLEEGAARAAPIVRREREGAEPAEEWAAPNFSRDTPLTVIVADAQNFGTQGSLEAHRRLWQDGQEEWLALSDDAERIVAEGRGHMVHVEDPELVLRAILGSSPGGSDVSVR